MREGIPIRPVEERRVMEQPKATPGVFFVDCETTGLDPVRHEVWEVALILPNGKEHVWQLPVHLNGADPKALQMNGFLDRYDMAHTMTQEEFGAEFVRLTWGLHWAGAVPSFDEQRIRFVLANRDQYMMGPGNPVPMTLPPNWHYHLIDIEALAVGYLVGESQYELVLPWDSTHLSDAVGVDRSMFDKHTALGDAQWARAVYMAVMERRSPEKEEPF